MINCNIMENRYQIQTLNSDGQWKFEGGKFHAMSMDNRIYFAIRKGYTAEKVRVWDHVTGAVYAPQPSVELTNEQKAERAEIERKNAILNAQYKAEAEAKLAAAQKVFDVQLAQYHAAVSEAEQSLESKTVDMDNYLSLNQHEKDVLINKTTEAYTSTNIDGYGDEGAGYDADKFVENLLRLGWVYQPQQNS